MRMMPLIPLLLSTLQGCSNCKDETSECYADSGQSTPHTQENYNDPQMKMLNPKNGDHRETSLDFGDSTIDTHMLPISIFSCNNPIEVEYQLFDADGNATRPLAFVDEYDHDGNDSPFELEESPEQLVDPTFSTNFDTRYLIQLSSTLFLATGINDGVFSFTTEALNSESNWFIEVLFAAHDGENISSPALRVQFQIECE